MGGAALGAGTATASAAPVTRKVSIIAADKTSETVAALVSAPPLPEHPQPPDPGGGFRGRFAHHSRCPSGMTAFCTGLDRCGPVLGMASGG